MELLLEDLARDLDNRHRVRPPGVESKMNNYFGEFSFGQAIILSLIQVTYKLLGISVRDERSDSNQTAVSLRQLCSFPNIAKQHIVREFRQLRREIAINR